MESLAVSLSGLRKLTQASEKIHTTLYDLVEVLNAETEPYEEDIVTAIVAHILNSKRVLCTGVLKGYRLTCGTTAYAS
jgi:hypothetical protein